MLSKLIGVARVVTCAGGPRRLKSSRNVTAGGLVFRTPFFFGGAALGGVMILWQPILRPCSADISNKDHSTGYKVFYQNTDL